MLKRLSYVKRKFRKNSKKRNVKKNYRKRSVKRNIKKNYRKRSVKRKYRGGSSGNPLLSADDGARPRHAGGAAAGAAGAADADPNLQLFFKYYSGTNKECNTFLIDWPSADNPLELEPNLNQVILDTRNKGGDHFIHQLDSWNGGEQFKMENMVISSFTSDDLQRNEAGELELFTSGSDTRISRLKPNIKTRIEEDAKKVKVQCNNLGVVNRMSHVLYSNPIQHEFVVQTLQQDGCGLNESINFNSKIIQNSYTLAFQEQIEQCLIKLLESKNNKKADDYLTIYEGYYINSNKNLYPMIFNHEYSIIPDKYGICAPKPEDREEEKMEVYEKIRQYVVDNQSEMSDVETSVDILKKGGYAHLELRYKCNHCNTWIPKRNMKDITENSFICKSCSKFIEDAARATAAAEEAEAAKEAALKIVVRNQEASDLARAEGGRSKGRFRIISEEEAAAKAAEAAAAAAVAAEAAEAAEAGLKAAAAEAAAATSEAAQAQGGASSVIGRFTITPEIHTNTIGEQNKRGT